MRRPPRPRSLGEPVESLTLKVDPGTYKNGAAVVVPNSGGGKGNLIAAVLGAILARPEEKLLVLQGVTEEAIALRSLTIPGTERSTTGTTTYCLLWATPSRRPIDTMRHLSRRYVTDCEKSWKPGRVGSR